MNSIFEVIRRPLVTEKTTLQKEGIRTLVFEVHRDATKPDIKKAVEKLFSVKVEQVRTSNLPGKLRRQGRYQGHRPDWKKAYVLLKEGEKMIEFHEAIS
jgi:large subunit ribosomal protein L23